KKRPTTRNAASGLVSRASTFPTVSTPAPQRIRYMRPSSRPMPVAAIDGQTVMITASSRSGGVTPAIGGFKVAADIFGFRETCLRRTRETEKLPDGQGKF